MSVTTPTVERRRTWPPRSAGEEQPVRRVRTRKPPAEERPKRKRTVEASRPKLAPVFVFYGGNREFAKYKGPEAILHGPAETGKTISALWKLHLCAMKYKNASIVIARKVRDTIYPTVLATFMTKVLSPDCGVKPYGGERPAWFDYPSGSRVWVAGLDRPGKVLSAEHDLIYVNQAEELSLDDWETLTTRATGRAGHMPYAQTIGDCNPTYPSHWLYHRTTLRLFYSRHEDNPTLFDPITGQITEQGKRTMAVLDGLTGVRKERLRYGRAAQAEGAVYEEWDEARHLIYAEQMPQPKRFFAAQDWGYTNPGVFGVWAVDGEGRMYLVRQVYRTGRTLEWWQDTALTLQDEFGRFEAVVCDPAEPAYIEAYRQKGLNAIPGDNAILPGINKVKERLAKERLFILRSSLTEVDEVLEEQRKPVSVQDEFPAYVWANKATKEQPIAENDHGMDMVRYAVQYVDGRRGWARGPAR
jgi:phage terminase large subunit